MTNEHPKPDTPRKKTDPRLKSFLRKAGAIITAEKGLNASSRIKLESLAKHDKLPKELLDEALKLLQSDDISNLTHYEKAFLKFLEREFAKIKGGVLSLGMEHRAIKRAESKYQINNTRAEQLIEAQSQAAGVSRISPDEAAVFADQIIVDRVGTQVTVPEELRAQLYKIGSKWAYSKQQVDQIIFREVSKNRAKRYSTLFKTTATTLAILALVGLGIAYSSGMLNPNNLKTVATKNQPEIQPGPNNQPPESTIQKLQSLAASDQPLANLVSKITDNNVTQRLLGYQQLARTICLTDRFDRTEIPNLVQTLYYEEQSDQAAQAILGAITECVERKNLNQNVSVASLKSAYRANNLLGQLSFGNKFADQKQNPRQLAAKRIIAEYVQVPISPEQPIVDYLNRSETAIATDQWTGLIQSTWSAPAKSSMLYQSVFDITKDLISAESHANLSNQALISIVKADDTQWRNIRKPVNEALESCDEARLGQWISIYLDSSDPTFQTFAGPLISRRIDVQGRTQSRKDIFEAIAKYDLAIRNTKLTPVTSRNDSLESLVDGLLQRHEPSSNNDPNKIAEVALGVNKLYAFCQSLETVPNIDETSFSLYDRISELDKPILRNIISLPIDRSDKEAGPKLPTSSDISRKNSSLDRISNLAAENSGLRKLAIDQLARVSARFDRLTYEESEILASYLLSDFSTEEFLHVQQRIEAFAKWPNLSLAIADKLPQSESSTDRAFTIARLLLGAELESTGGGNWKTDLQSQIYRLVSSEVAKQVSLDPDNSKSDWNRLEIYLANTYRDRLSIAKQSTNLDSLQLPSQTALALVNYLSDSGAVANSREFAQANTIVNKSSSNEIARIVLANQFLTRSLYKTFEKGEQSRRANNLINQYESQNSEGVQIGERLYESELLLLRLLDLKRKSLVNQLLTRNK